MSAAEQLFDHICNTLSDRAVRGKMFGAPCMKTGNGKAAFCLYKDTLVFKPDARTLTEVLAMDRVQMFAPMGDRAMNGWAQMGMEYADRWLDMAEKSVAFVATLEANTPKSRKK